MREGRIKEPSKKRKREREGQERHLMNEQEYKQSFISQ